jgi:alanyl-tRNA synthetase
MRHTLMQQTELTNDVHFIGKVVDVPHADALKKLCFDLKNHMPENHLVVLCANVGGKANVAVGLGESLASSKSLDAGKIIKELVSPLIKGGGGGQKTLATAGGQDINQFDTLIQKIKEMC